MTSSNCAAGVHSRAAVDLARAQASGAIASPDVIWAENGDGKHWYRADLGVTVVTGVSQWDDQIGSADPVQATTSLQPALNTPGTENGQDSITFDGVDDVLVHAGGFTDLDAAGTYFMCVYKLGSGTPTGFAGAMGGTPATTAPGFGWGSGGTRYWFSRFTGDADEAVVTSVLTDTSIHLHETWHVAPLLVTYEVDGGAEASATGAETQWTDTGLDFWIGRNANAPGVTVEIFEIFFGIGYTSSRQAQMQTYVNDRYGLSI